MSEMLVSVTPPAGLFAVVRGQHVPVVALAVVRISDVDETWDVVKAVVAGPDSEDGLVDLADCHDSSECSGHGCEPVPIRRRGAA